MQTPHQFVNLEVLQQKYEEYPDYEIPEEDLLDPDFAAIMEEATKYLGFPYVWGGAMPSTSFDCSGYVSYVLNQSGWNIGRLGSQSLYDKAVKLRAEDVRPGDLIFFTGARAAEISHPVTHVGIYVGNGMMVHAQNSRVGVVRTPVSQWLGWGIYYAGARRVVG